MSAVLSFISPLTITAAMIASSNAVSHSSTELNWNALTNYTKGTIVYRSTFNRRYECLVGGVDSGLPEDTPLRWYDLEETDQLTMFDGEVSTASIADDALTVVVSPGAFNAMFLALDGLDYDITIRDGPGGALIHHFSGDLEGSEPADYYEHFYAPFEPRTDLLLTGLDPYSLCQVTIVINNPGAIAGCGMCAFGDLTSLGKTLSGGRVETKSYNRITADSRGKTKIRRGKTARDMAVTAIVDMSEFDAVNIALARVSGVPCVWIATDSKTLQTMRSFGLGNGSLVNNTSHAVLTHNTQGMI
jgi:hypothetical protein